MRRTVLVVSIAAIVVVLMVAVVFAIGLLDQPIPIQQEALVQLDGDYVYHLGWDGEVLGVVGGRRIGMMYASAPGHPRVVGQGEEGIYSEAGFSSDGRLVATNGLEGLIEVWWIANEELLARITGAQIGSPIAVDGGQGLVAAAGDGGVLIWDIESGDILHTIEQQGLLIDAAFSPDGSVLATTHCLGSFPECQTDVIYLWSVETGMLQSTRANENVVFEIAFSPDGTTLIGLSPTGPAEVWDWQAGQLARQLAPIGIATRAVAFTPDGRYVVTGGLNGVIELWRVGTGSKVAEVPIHDNTITGLAFSPDGSRLASISEDGDLRLWTVTLP